MAVTAAGGTREAFDSVAPEYHQSNAANPVLRGMRRRTIAAVRRFAGEGERLLDLGCGPGTDAETLAPFGYRIVAVDQSPRMVEEARSRIQRAGLDGSVSVHQLGIEDLDALPFGEFDAVYSSFGPLNCVADLERAARGIGQRLRVGGVLVASVIGRICPWELALFLSRGDAARARVRFASGPVAVPLNGHVVWTRYYTPGEFVRPFRAAGFHRVALRALGLFAPPPYLQAFAERHPALVQRLERLDDVLGGWPVLRNAGDHFLVVLRKGS